MGLDFSEGLSIYRELRAVAAKLDDGRQEFIGPRCKRGRPDVANNGDRAGGLEIGDRITRLVIEVALWGVIAGSLEGVPVTP